MSDYTYCPEPFVSIGIANMRSTSNHVRVSEADFRRFTIAATAAASVDELRNALIEFHAGSGIKMMSYHHLPPPGAADYTKQITVVAYGFPAEWVKRYQTEFIDIDPIPRRALSATQAFLWSEATMFADLTKEERRYLEELIRANLGDGLAVPVFGPRGRNGYVGLGFGTDAQPPDAVARTFLQMACQLGHQEYCRMLFAEHPQPSNLSPRESEILMWVARGKSNAVISSILSISGHTVDTHLRRTFDKLGVNDRVTAALRGAALGLL
ncbi:MAG: LuxR family transcriptional regulator [Pseudomonadota bacterium]